MTVNIRFYFKVSFVRFSETCLFREIMEISYCIYSTTTSRYSGCRFKKNGYKGAKHFGFYMMLSCPFQAKAGQNRGNPFSFQFDRHFRMHEPDHAVHGNGIAKQQFHHLHEFQIAAVRYYW